MVVLYLLRPCREGGATCLVGRPLFKRWGFCTRRERGRDWDREGDECGGDGCVLDDIGCLDINMTA